MPRLSITLSDEQYLALKETSVRTRKTLRHLIEESLSRSGIKTLETAYSLVAKARECARLKESKALELAVKETRASRQR